MFDKAGELRQVKLLRLFSVRHHTMLSSDVCHTPVEQQTAGGVGSVASLDIQAAEGFSIADKGEVFSITNAPEQSA